MMAVEGLADILLCADDDNDNMNTCVGEARWFDGGPMRDRDLSAEVKR